MEPSWSEIKHILRRHEDIFEGSKSQIGEFVVKFNNMEQMVIVLFHRTNSLDQERHRTFALEQKVAMLLQRMNRLEQELKQL